MQHEQETLGGTFLRGGLQSVISTYDNFSLRESQRALGISPVKFSLNSKDPATVSQTLKHRS